MKILLIGLSSIRENLANWNWCYGKTPDFTICRHYPSKHYSSDNIDANFCVKLFIKQGIIDDITVFIPPGMSKTGFSGEAKAITGLKGRKYADNLLDSIEKYLGINHVDNFNEKHNDFIRHAVLSV